MPFEYGNLVRGPGVYDMKGGITQIIFALEALTYFGISPVVTPIIFANSDEEIGSRELAHYIRRLARLACRAFVLEPSLGRDGKLKTTRKGVGRFTIKVTGRAAHAGLDPEKGASAILELSHVVQALFALNDAEKGVTVNVGTIEGGLRPNVVAPESAAVVDVRVRNKEDADRVTRAIYGLEKLETRGFYVSPLPRTDWASGDYALCEVLGRPGPLYQVEQSSGRMCQVFDGDLIVGAFGTRASTLEGVGDWRNLGEDGRLHALTSAGLFGKATSVSPLLPPLMNFQYRGHLIHKAHDVGLLPATREASTWNSHCTRDRHLYVLRKDDLWPCNRT